VDISAWLRELGLERYEQAFQDNQVDARSLPHLTADDLKDMGVTAIGHRRLLLQAIAQLGEPPRTSDEARPEATAAETSRSKLTVEAERRQLTVLFVDLVGSTELSGRLDPEEMSEVIRAYHTGCADVIRRWDGYLAKYMGDGVLAYYGWPRAHEDDAERAVRAGLELVDAVAALKPHAEMRLRARVGIATGQVVVGDLVGEGAARDEAVVGETPNLAARLQALAEPGTVVISQATRRLVGGSFELADLGPKRLKGFAEPLTAFRIEGKGRAEGRFEALHGKRLTPLVGREHELDLLLERWAWAKDGDGQVVLISGEPGIGKSRLIRALRERLGNEPYTPLSHYCSPYHTNSALYPVIGLLERTARLDRDDPPEAQLTKLEAVLARSSERLEEALPLLAALLGVPTAERYPALTLTPEVQKRRTLQALLDQLAGLAAKQPVLAVYEDAHWVDPSTLELLGLVIERIRQLPVLVLITFRPEFEPPWTGQAHVTTLTMSRLGRRQGADLVARVTGDTPLPGEIVEQIVARTDGVPLFVEELTKAVLETGETTIPASLYGSLMARLDCIPEIREIAQIAACIGREFSYGLLASVAGKAESELRIALDRLAAAELIFRRGVAPDATYTFKHALLQDAAYQSLLKSRRQALHGRIFAVLEQDFDETAPEVLAPHASEAGRIEQAIGYWEQAGQAAYERAAHKEAIAHYRAALDLVAKIPDNSLRRRLEARLLIGLASPTGMLVGFGAAETEEIYRRAFGASDRQADPGTAAAALEGVWHAQHARGDERAAKETADQQLAEAKRDGSWGALQSAYCNLGSSAVMLGEFSAARDALTCIVRLRPSSRNPCQAHRQGPQGIRVDDGGGRRLASGHAGHRAFEHRGSRSAGESIAPTARSSHAGLLRCQDPPPSTRVCRGASACRTRRAAR
jgi:class 3 adenylate cyclase/tetratricopeptide (TPR) repeat protein